ncbi:hypothetical protein RhiirA5_430167 [Rhizophagus irregularis]|uniref:Uncharacterized protein n=1 Tax=Rhizophagus irregularis TaxID=588596 RepID=A0A2N0NX76_9GLOM|nr:hypothetical protein RhiirA5_430167 [Rhizophagus irregularis]
MAIDTRVVVGLGLYILKGQLLSNWRVNKVEETIPEYCDKRSERLQFTTELEAVPIYCMHSSLLAFKREHRLTEPGRIGNDKLYKETVKGGNCGLTLLHKHCTNYLNNNKCLEVKKNLKFFKSKEFKFVIIISEYSD